MAAIKEIYGRVIYREQTQDQSSPDFRLHPEMAATPESTYSQMLQRLAIDSPRLREIATRSDLSQHARRNLDRFLSSAGTSSERYGAVLRSPAAVEQALTIFQNSDFLTDILVRHPDAVVLLDEIEQRRAQDRLELVFESDRPAETCDDPVVKYLGGGKVDRAEAMSILRQQYRRQVFLSGALDLFRHRDIFDSLRDNTAAADAAIYAAFAMAAAPESFAALSLGRLGTREFDFLSDADLLFVCNDGCDRSIVGRAAEHLMEALTAYTKDGTVFSVDTRLRPHGREGELVVTPVQLETYFAEEAKPWEALTYLKLRWIAGDRQLADRVMHVVRAGIAQMATREGFELELSDLRDRLERSESPQNLKTGPGGSYDIDYLAGLLQAKHRLWVPGNVSDRLQGLEKHGFLPHTESRELLENARFLRTVEHVIRLVSGRARKWLPVADHPKRSVQKLLWTMLNSSDSFNPEIRLTEIMRRNREIYRQYLGT